MVLENFVVWFIMLKENYSQDDQKSGQNGKLAAFSCLAGSEHNLKSCLDGAK